MFSIINGVFWNDRNSIEDWADMLHHTSASLQRYLGNLRKLLAQYDCSIEEEDEVLVFRGEEVAIRKFLLDYFYEAKFTAHTILPTKKINEVTNVIIAKYQLSISFLKLSYILLIISERVKNDETLLINDELRQSVKKDKNYESFQAVGQLLEEELSLILNEDELIYFYILTNTDRSIFDINREISWVYSYHSPKIEAIVEEYCKNLCIVEDTQKRICIHSFFVTSYLLYQLSPIYVINLADINSEVQKRYRSELVTAEHLLEKKIQAVIPFGASLKESFFVNLVILQTALDDIYHTCKKKIGVLLEGHSYSVTKFLSTFIRYFKGQHELVFLTPVMPQANLEAEKIDIVITNYPLHVTEYLDDINYLLINTIPDAEDWNNILCEIEPNMTRSFCLTNSSS